jgi:uncharacterized protein (TIGR00290 family)
MIDLDIRKEERPLTMVSWSSGKDSMMALAHALASGSYRIAGLLATITSDFGRVSIHGVREELLEIQASQLGLPLTKVVIPPKCSNELYQSKMSEAVDKMLHDGISRIVFGDIFLSDVRKYRETMLEGSGIEPVFPLWGRNSRELATDIVRTGIRAKLVCLDPAKVDRTLAGCEFDPALIERLPENVDPCGENGEFHTFVYASPVFRDVQIPIRLGSTIERDGFVFTDILPVGDTDKSPK